jgi:hypothetical protein
MSNFVSLEQGENALAGARRRGRRHRPEGEAFRTVAWFRNIERSVHSPSSNALASLWGGHGIEVDPKTLDRYRAGRNTPTEQRRRHVDQFMPGTCVVFDVGPGGVPLWDSMWSTTSALDWRLAEALLPDGRWPTSSIFDVFCEDAWLGRILEFCENIQHQVHIGQLPWASQGFDPDLIALSAAIRVFRVNSALDRVNADLHDLLRGCLALPGASDTLSMFGVFGAMSTWVDERCANTGRLGRSTTSWMSDRAHFLRLVEQTAARRRATREALWSGLFSIPSTR